MANMVIKKKCIDCGQEFDITAGGQKFYAEHGWELPKRCKSCRDARKAAKKAKAAAPSEEKV